MEALSEITNCLPKRRKTDPLWHLLDEIGNKRYCQLCHKDYSIETGLTTIKAHFKREHLMKYTQIKLHKYILNPIVRKMKIECKL